MGSEVRKTLRHSVPWNPVPSAVARIKGVSSERSFHSYFRPWVLTCHKNSCFLDSCFFFFLMIINGAFHLLEQRDLKRERARGAHLHHCFTAQESSPFKGPLNPFFGRPPILHLCGLPHVCLLLPRRAAQPCLDFRVLRSCSLSGTSS